MKGGLQDVVTPLAWFPGCAWRVRMELETWTPEVTLIVRPSRLLLFLIALLIPVSSASAAVPHTVQPGETLWSIAASNNLTTRTVAAFNGLSEDSQVVLGSTIMVPTTVEGYAALQQAGLVPAGSAATRPAFCSAA